MPPLRMRSARPLTPAWRPGGLGGRNGHTSTNRPAAFSRGPPSASPGATAMAAIRQPPFLRWQMKGESAHDPERAASLAATPVGRREARRSGRRTREPALGFTSSICEARRRPAEGAIDAASGWPDLRRSAVLAPAFMAGGPHAREGRTKCPGYDPVRRNILAPWTRSPPGDKWPVVELSVPGRQSSRRRGARLSNNTPPDANGRSHRTHMLVVGWPVASSTSGPFMRPPGLEPPGAPGARVWSPIGRERPG
jgi:hypothetical protein